MHKENLSNDNENDAGADVSLDLDKNVEEFDGFGG